MEEFETKKIEGNLVKGYTFYCLFHYNKKECKSERLADILKTQPSVTTHIFDDNGCETMRESFFWNPKSNFKKYIDWLKDNYCKIWEIGE